MTAAAPHLQRTANERRGLALHLAQIALLPLQVPFVASDGCMGTVEQLHRAHRHMATARWHEAAADLLEMVIRPAEEQDAGLRRIQEAHAAGRWLCPADVSALLPVGYLTRAVEGLDQGMVADQNGNYIHGYFWRADQRSPWREIGVRAYEKLLALIAEASKPGILEHLRSRAEFIWSHLTEEERRSFS